MTTATSSERRDQLLSAARAVLAEKGFDGTTVSEIVSRAGVAQGTFYLYFPSKASLVGALCDEMFARILSAVIDATEGKDAFAETLEAGVRAVFAETAAYKDVLDIIGSRTVLLGTLGEIERADEPYYRLIAGLLERGQARGEVDPAVRPDLAARLVVGLIERATDDCFIYRPGTPTEPYIEEILRFVGRALGAARA